MKASALAIVPFSCLHAHTPKQPRLPPQEQAVPLRKLYSSTNMAPALQDMQAFLQLLRQKVEIEASGPAQDSDITQEPDQTHSNWQQPVLEDRTVTYSTGDSYKGLLLGNQRHGQGVHTTSTGDVYDGGWSYDQRSGTGKFTMADGTCYEGEWEDDKAHGMGKCTYRDGSVYDGEWRADERWGWGTLTTADGQQYEGEWEHNQPHGQGRWVLADGLSYYEGSYDAGRRQQGRLVLYDSKTKKLATTYTGSFHNNLKHGEGVMVCEGTWIYQGAWRNDTRCGQGTCKYISGDEYVGDWKDDRKDGSGVLTLISGDCYDGDWLEDNRHGVGKMKYATGERYVGHWQHGQRHGQGKWSSAPKAVPNTAAAAAADEVRETYFGHWVNDKREGQGVAVFADGGRYQGSWQADKRHGEGVMTFPDGIIFRGMWENDQWIQSAADPTLCRITGPGISRALAGEKARFKITARDENNNPRLSGGDTFNVLLVPARKLTLPAVEVALLQQQQQEQQQQQQQAGSFCMAGLQSDMLAGNTKQGRSTTQSSTEKQQQLQLATDSPFSLTEVVTAVAEGDVQDHGDGSYSCSYSYKVAGQYELHITNGDGEHIADSPYPIRVLPGPPSARHSTVSGPGRHAAVAGTTVRFEVTVRDAHGNEYSSSSSKWREGLNRSQLLEQFPLKAELRGSNTLPVAAVEVVAQPGGCYACSYIAPPAAAAAGLYGLYVLEVTSAGKHLRGSPFSVQVTVAAQAAAEAKSAAAADSTTTANRAACSSGSGKQLEDKVALWAQVAKEAYAAVDGSLDGFEQQQGSAAVEGSANGMSAQEAEMVKANPQLPVVQRLEDLWLLSKLQQERKLREQVQSTTSCNKTGNQQPGHQAKAVQQSHHDSTQKLDCQDKQQQQQQQRHVNDQQHNRVNNVASPADVHDNSSSSAGVTDADQTASVGKVALSQPGAEAEAADADATTPACQASTGIERNDSVDAAVQILLQESNKGTSGSCLGGKTTDTTTAAARSGVGGEQSNGCGGLAAKKSLLYELD